MKTVTFAMLVVVALAVASVASLAADVSHTTSNLSQARYGLAATATEGKVFFGGGATGIGSQSDVVDIYDAASGTWEPTLSLPEGRVYLAAASGGNKILFGGGWNGGYKNTVDIYDTATESWSTAALTNELISLSSASVGGKLFFGGGSMNSYPNCTDVVDIYNTATGTWSTTNLSQARAGAAATSCGGKVFFGPGVYVPYPEGPWTNTNVVDIYAANGTLLQTTTVPHDHGVGYAIASSGGKVFFAGGSGISGNYTNVVDIYDTVTGTWSTATLSQARRDLSVAVAGGMVFFAGGRSGEHIASSVVDIYDIYTGWSTTTLSEGRWDLSAASVGYTVFFAGGDREPGENGSNMVDIYTVVPEPGTVAMIVSALAGLAGIAFRKMRK